MTNTWQLTVPEPLALCSISSWTPSVLFTMRGAAAVHCLVCHGCHVQPCLARQRLQTSRAACQQALAWHSGQGSCWRTLQKDRCQREALASPAPEPRSASAWALKHTASRRGWLQCGQRWFAWPRARSSWAKSVFSVSDGRRFSCTLAQLNIFFNLKYMAEGGGEFGWWSRHWL